MEHKRNTSLPIVIARGAVIAALMVAVNMMLAPISYGPLQFRLSTALVVFAVFGWEYVFGIVIGTSLSNMIGGLGVLDFIVMPLVNLVFLSIAYVSLKQIDHPWMKLFIVWLFECIIWICVAMMLTFLFKLDFGLMVLSIIGSCSIVFWTFGAGLYTVARKWLNAVL